VLLEQPEGLGADAVQAGELGEVVRQVRDGLVARVDQGPGRRTADPDAAELGPPVVGHEPSAAETTSRASFWTSARWSGPRKDSA